MSLVHFLRVSPYFTLNQESGNNSFFFFFWQINLAGYVCTDRTLVALGIRDNYNGHVANLYFMLKIIYFC